MTPRKCSLGLPVLLAGGAPLAGVDVLLAGGLAAIIVAPASPAASLVAVQVEDDVSTAWL